MNRGTFTCATWNIGLSAWVIQDGNYPDFAVGETIEFGVEFHWQPGTAVEVCDSDVIAALVKDATYQVVAEKIRETDKTTVLDIGILVYSQFGPQFPDVQHGNRFRTELWLDVDPYHSSPLVYSWRITSILRQTAPFIEVASRSGPFGGKVLTRDVSKLGYEEIPRTDAWKDDTGLGEYILRCKLLGPS
jgi:hypothetical protein